MFVVVPRRDRLRPVVEDAIRNLYWKRYSASLSSFASMIVAEVTQCGHVECAAGIRFGNETFFSECYLELPMEQALADHLADTVDRERIVEVCHLAGMSPGHSLPFVQTLIGLLRTMDIEWAVFTATKPLRNLLQRNRLAMIELGCADRSRVPNPESWGDYFRYEPRIMAVSRMALAPSTLAEGKRAMFLTCFNQGFEAYRSNYSRSDCPYPHAASRQHKAWQEGYSYAMSIAPKRFHTRSTGSHLSVDARIF
jgi:Thermostable hemolysin